MYTNLSYLNSAPLGKKFILLKPKLKERNSLLDVRFSTSQLKLSKKLSNIMIQRRIAFLIQLKITQNQFIKFYFHVKMIQLETIRIKSWTKFGCSPMMAKVQISLKELIWVNLTNSQLWSKRIFYTKEDSMKFCNLTVSRWPLRFWVTEKETEPLEL